MIIEITFNSFKKWFIRICVALVLITVIMNIWAFFVGEENAFSSNEIRIGSQIFQMTINKSGTEVTISDLKGNGKSYLVDTDSKNGIIILQEK